MSNAESHHAEHIKLIEEIEHKYAQTEIHPEKQLMYLLDGMISGSPEEALRFLQIHKNNGIPSLGGIRGLATVLMDQLLRKQNLPLVEELVQLNQEWGLPVETTDLNKLVKVYRQQGKVSRARDLLYSMLKKDRARAAEIVTSLYDIARDDGQHAEAHVLLQQLMRLDSSTATVSFAYHQRSVLAPESGRPVRIALLSSYTIDPLVPYLDGECRSVGLVPEFYLAPFNQYMQEILQSSSGLYRFKPEILFVALAIEDLFPAVRGYPTLEDLDKAETEVRERIQLMVNEICAHSDAIVVVHDFVLTHRSPHGILDRRSVNGLNAWIEGLNRALADYFRNNERVFSLHLGEVVGWVGKAQCHNPKMEYMAGMRLSNAVMPELARQSMRYVKPLKGLTRKCVVLDLDGTLWGGIAGEVGIEGIQLGPTAPGVEYRDFQEALLGLTQRGILLAICSKNNPDDVLPIIQNHPHMWLREEHFAASRINWQNKAQNIRELADDLNIGLDSMVFFDDNPNERELIKQMLPEVLTVELPTDPSRYRTMLEGMSDFEVLALTKEDEQRGSQYKAMHQRRAARISVATMEEYLHSLEIVAEIEFARLESIGRLVQMFNKTNQLNLTTRRYQSADFTRFLAAKEYHVYTLTVRDRFGDHGLVGAAIVQKEGTGNRIESLLMSCRVMGLSVETAFLHKISEDTRQAGIQLLIGEFIPTKKNQPVEKLYADHGFALAKEQGEHQFWELDLASSKIERPAWVALTGVL